MKPLEGITVVELSTYIAALMRTYSGNTGSAGH